MRFTKISEPKDLLEHCLKDIYSAEEQIVEALPKVIESVSSSELATALQNHLAETEVHVKRLEEVADMLDLGKLSGVKCKGMEGLLSEGEEAIKNIEKGGLLDAELAGGCRKVEHYEMLAYTNILNLMSECGCKEAAVILLEKTLDEEEMADQKLTNF